MMNCHRQNTVCLKCLVKFQSEFPASEQRKNFTPIYVPEYLVFEVQPNMVLTAVF